MLARRSISDPAEVAYYACYGPARSRLVDLAWVAGSRWHIEECFHQAKNEAGLDHYQVRSGRAWHAHITLSMLALAWLAASRAHRKRGNQPQRPGPDRHTLPEIRRLLTDLAHRYLPDPEHVLAWPNWRRRRQYQARLCHYRRRGYALT